MDSHEIFPVERSIGTLRGAAMSGTSNLMTREIMPLDNQPESHQH
jgi:hypothetical protein